MTTDPNTTRSRGGTAVEDRTTTRTVGSSIGLGVVGVVAGIAAVSDVYPVMLGVVAIVLGLITVVPALTAWKRARDRHGEAVGTSGTNLSIGGLVAGAAAIVLGIVGMTAVGGAETIDEGVDGVQQDAEQLGDDVEDGL